MTSLFNFFKSILNRFLQFLQFLLVFLYIVFEEIIWDFIAEPIYRLLESFHIVQKLDLILRSANRYIILVIFIVLFTTVEALGIFAGGLIVSGNIFFGVALYMAKIPIAVFTFWMFKVVKSKLMTFEWFRISFYALENILNLIKNSKIYKSTIDIFLKTKEFIKLELQYFKGKILSGRSRFIYRFKRLYFFY